MKAGFRQGDNAALAVIEFVDRDTFAKGAADKAALPPRKKLQPLKAQLFR